MYYKNEDETYVYAECERCNEEVKLSKYALLKRVGDSYKASRYITCFKCKQESNLIVNIETRLEELRETQLKPYIIFKNETEKVFELLNSDNEVIQLMRNFIQTLDSDIGNKNNILYFEHLLRSQMPIGNLLLRNIDKINIIPTTPKQNVDDDYKDKFHKLVFILNKNYRLKSEEEAMYVSWMLLQNEIIHHRAADFSKEFGVDYNNVEKSLESYVEKFCGNPIVNLDSSQTINSFTYYLISEGLLPSRDIVNEFDYVQNHIKAHLNKIKIDKFEKQLLGLHTTPKKISWDMSDIDLMTGHEFEHFVSGLFTKMGYLTTVTKGSGDQGIDVIVEKNDLKYGIQVKCYSNTVTNKAIQEVVAGIAHYKLDRGIVITNNYFTSSATELALSNNILLWDRNIIKEKIKEYY
ncbi:restriction endonuclease [Paenibacillus sp. FSL P2-0089]|uniref:restriction endonuclease n=1 Tax=Paenibacillus sp. FSL P2-0089 TaxID=2954526 RepID=UPI00315B38A1